MNKKILFAIPVVCLMTMANQGCESSDTIQNRQQELISKQAIETVGLPNIINFAEKALYKLIYELRDKNIPTYTYTQDMNGKLHKLCNSFGYPIPYATQYTSPVNNVGRPQADPNGLFSPSSADGTFVLCNDPKTKKNWPIYSEPKLITSPFELE